MVTWKALGIILLSLGSVGMLGYGFLSILAGGMSDNPSAGADAEIQGKFLIIAGVVCAGIALIIGVFL